MALSQIKISSKNMKRKEKNRKPLIIACALAALLAGYFFWLKPKYNQANSNNASLNSPSVVEVSVIHATKEKVELFVELPGRVHANKIADLRPQISGVIKQVKFIEGSFVKKGQPLYEIDSSIYKAAYDSANSSLRAMQMKRDRYQNLLAQDAISKQEFDDINASLEQAKSAASTAKKNLDYTKVLAPISGYIGKSNLTEGALVTDNQTEVLATITQLDPVYVDMEQPSKDVIAIGHHKKIPVTLVTEDPTYVNVGELKFSEMFADESTDSVRLRAVFSNKQKRLLPGMFVSGRLHLKPFEGILVPQRVTNRMPNGSLVVWVVAEGNIAKPRVIKAEKTYQDSWVVDDGLNEGDVIIYEGFQKVSDGTKVNPLPFVIAEKK